MIKTNCNRCQNNVFLILQIKYKLYIYINQLDEMQNSNQAALYIKSHIFFKRKLLYKQIYTYKQISLISLNTMKIISPQEKI